MLDALDRKLNQLRIDQEDPYEEEEIPFEAPFDQFLDTFDEEEE